MKENFYITTTIPYVNADPHIGFALEIVQADTVARWQRLLGKEVFFSTGTDEYGQKILEAATKENKSPQEYADVYAARFSRLKDVLNLSNDNFIRTTSAAHQEAAQEFWRLCRERGDIYKKPYRGLYCVGCEKFLREQDLVEGHCPLHPNLAPEEVEEENYFFKFSRYHDQLLTYLDSPDVILPDWRKEEARQFVRGGLEDFSISRTRARLPWGILVPDDPDHVMYVWFGAFVNYISTLGWPQNDATFKKFWQEGITVQAAGKDMVRFQSLMWQAMLMSAGFKPTTKIFYHGFITSGGQKMSKSLGNVIDPATIVEEYGTDALRYYLLREINTFEDGDFTHERFKEAYNANLANGLGNLVSRVLKMSETYLSAVPEIPGDSIPDEYKKYMERFEIQKAADFVWATITKLDLRIQETEPFKLVKHDRPAAEKIISELVVELYTIGRMLNPILPKTSRIIKEAVKNNRKPENLFARK